MLADAPRSQIGEWSFASMLALIASAPSTVHDLYDAYWIQEGLSALRLVEVSVTAFFAAALVVAYCAERGNKTSTEIYDEIIRGQQAPVVLNVVGSEVAPATSTTGRSW